MGGVCSTGARRAEVKRIYDYSLFLQLMGQDKVETIMRYATLRRVDDAGGGPPARIGQIVLVFDGSVDLFQNGVPILTIRARMPLENGQPVSIIERPRDARYAPGPDSGPTVAGNPNSGQILPSGANSPTSVRTDEVLIYWKSNSEIVCRYASETGGDEFILKSVICDQVAFQPRSRFLALSNRYLISPKGEAVPTLNALTNTDLISALSGVPFFAGLPNDKLVVLTEMSAIRVYPSNCVIFREDEGISTQMFITLAGALEVTSSRASAPLARLEAGSFFGEMSLLINIPRAATVRAVENCMLMSVEKKSFHALLEKSPELRESVNKLLKERLVLKALASGVLPYFSSVPLTRIVELSHTMEIDDQIRKGDCVLDQEANDDRFFFLVYGALEILPAAGHRRGSSMHRDNAIFLTPGCYLGPFTFQRLNMRTGKVFARTPVVVLHCPFAKILELFHEFPDVAAAANIAWFGERCDLASVLRHAVLTQRFQAFLEAEHSDENFLFCLDVEKFRDATGIDRRNAAKLIFDRYVQSNAPKEINLPSTVKATIVSALGQLGDVDDPTPALFDNAWEEIMHLMTKDSFPRFKKSPLFQSVLDSLDPHVARKGSKLTDAAHAFRDSLHDLRPGQIQNVKSSQLNRMMSTIRKTHARHQGASRSMTTTNLRNMNEAKDEPPS